jgi:DNA-directed RNA polymerase specialized sigma subunit
MKLKDMDLSRSELEYLIEEYVLSSRDRRIMKSRVIDGMTYEDIAEMYDMSVTQICTIVKTCKERMFKHLQR